MVFENASRWRLKLVQVITKQKYWVAEQAFKWEGTKTVSNQNGYNQETKQE